MSPDSGPAPPALAGHPQGQAAFAGAVVAESRFEKALILATRIHAGDVRKGTAIPYVAHLLTVAALVLEQGGSEDQAVAALLHDAAEDHGGVPALDAIEATFGPTVREIVEGCSDSLPAEGASKEDWLPRKRRYLDHLREAKPAVLTVSLADKVHNARAILADVRAIGSAVFERFSAPVPKQDNTLEYYVLLDDIFEQRLGTPMAKELSRIVDELCTATGYRPTHELPAG